MPPLKAAQSALPFPPARQGTLPLCVRAARKQEVLRNFPFSLFLPPAPCRQQKSSPTARRSGRRQPQNSPFCGVKQFCGSCFLSSTKYNHYRKKVCEKSRASTSFPVGTSSARPAERCRNNKPGELGHNVRVRLTVFHDRILSARTTDGRPYGPVQTFLRPLQGAAPYRPQAPRRLFAVLHIVPRRLLQAPLAEEALHACAHIRG